MKTEREIEIEGQAHYSERRYAQALVCIEALHKMGRTETPLKVYEAQCLFYTGRAPEAAAIMRELLAAQPDSADYAILLSQYLRATGDFEESYAYLLTVPPQTLGYSMLMGWHRMRLGDFIGAFRLFQKEPGIIQLGERLKLPQEKQLKVGDDVRGKVVLYLMEGGFGDEILFSRFASVLEARGARVLIGASKRIIEILGSSLYAKNAREVGTISPDEYDYCLPAIFSIDILGIEDPMKGFTFPYLTASPAEAAHWKPIIAHEARGRKKIGIHWQGNWDFDTMEMKSPPAHLMLKFAELGRVFSLQRDAGGNGLPPGSPVFDAETGPPSWRSTAAVINEMDYIVTNDTSTAHLAGVLGKKTLVLLPHAPHFYWIMREHEAIWYPHMYTFRQPAYHDWLGAVTTAYQFIQKDS